MPYPDNRTTAHFNVPPEDTNTQLFGNSSLGCVLAGPCYAALLCGLIIYIVVKPIGNIVKLCKKKRNSHPE